MTMLLLGVDRMCRSRSHPRGWRRPRVLMTPVVVFSHSLRHRSQRRHGAARQPRHPELPHDRQHAGDPADGGQRARGQIRVAVRGAEADEAARASSSSHREDVGARVVRLRDEFDELQTRIGYRFRDRGLLEHALTHKSRAAEDASGGVADNESLEFLGDAVLGLVVADVLFRQYPTYDEGQKSKVKAAVVSTQSLARHAGADPASANT